MTALAGWENFYVIVGSSAGALIGLQFVVIALIADTPIARGQELAGAAFATPTIVHLSSVLLLSAILSAPWPGAGSAALLWGLLGAGGILYELIVARRMRAQAVYKPVFEDWLFHVLLPMTAYGALAGTACWAVRSNIGRAMFGVGAAALLLLFVGIHNAWDGITYHVFVMRQKRKDVSNHGP
jgi:hypothetical protein